MPRQVERDLLPDTVKSCITIRSTIFCDRLEWHRDMPLWARVSLNKELWHGLCIQRLYQLETHKLDSNRATRQHQRLAKWIWCHLYWRPSSLSMAKCSRCGPIWYRAFLERRRLEILVNWWRSERWQFGWWRLKFRRRRCQWRWRCLWWICKRVFKCFWCWKQLSLNRQRRGWGPWLGWDGEANYRVRKQTENDACTSRKDGAKSPHC